MIAFGTDCDFFIVLPIRLKICRSNSFCKMCAPEKSGASQKFSAPERAWARNLSWPETTTPKDCF